MDDLQEYLSWAHSKGVRWPKMRYPVIYEPGYPGSEATEDIATGETIISAPNEAMFTFQRARESVLTEIFDSEPETFNPEGAYYEDLVIASYMIYEKHRGRASEWYYFLKNQPSNPIVLSDWDPSELGELQDKDLVFDIKRRSMFDLDAYTTWQYTLSKYRDFFTKDMLDLAEFKWAWKLLTTRAFGKFVPSTSMVPIAEYLNHTNTSTFYCYSLPEDPVSASGRYTYFIEHEDHDDEWLDVQPALHRVYDTLGKVVCRAFPIDLPIQDAIMKEAELLDTAHFDLTRKKMEIDYYAPDIQEDPQKVFRIVAGEPGYKAGEQLFLSYGRYSNKQLLCYYGFALENNHYNYARVKVKIEEINPSHSGIVGELQVNAPFVFKLKMDFINTELLNVIRAAKWTPEVPPYSIFSPKFLPQEVEVLAVYSNLLEKRIQSFSTSLEEDLEMLRNEQPLRKHFALLYRTGVKQIIQRHIELARMATDLLKRKLDGEEVECDISLSGYLNNI